MVPKEGLEPTRACAHCDLNAARLPIPPLRLQHASSKEGVRKKRRTIVPTRPPTVKRASQWFDRQAGMPAPLDFSF